MEKFLEILFQQSALVIFMSVVMYFMWRIIKFLWKLIEKKDVEIKSLQEYILKTHQEQGDREKEISGERRDDMEDILKKISDITGAIKHNTDANKELAKEVRIRKA